MAVPWPKLAELCVDMKGVHERRTCPENGRSNFCGCMQDLGMRSNYCLFILQHGNVTKGCHAVAAVVHEEACRRKTSCLRGRLNRFEKGLHSP